VKLAFRELVRRPGRFATATAVLTLIAVLLIFLGGLLDGLIRSATGALEARDADLIVFSESSQASFLRSRIDPATRSAIEGVDGVAATGGVGVVLLGARVPGNEPRDLANVAVWGYELASDQIPEPPDAGEAWADKALQADGVELGDELLVGPAQQPVRVIGWVDDTSYSGQAGLWTNTSTWRSVLSTNRPDATLAPGTFQAIEVVGGGRDVTELATAINAATGGGTVSLTVGEAIEAIPGVTAQRTTFNQILGVTVVIALVVIALFFALLTVERSGLYGILKAVGARSSTIFGGLIIQAVVVTLIASSVAAAAAVVLDMVIPPGSIPLYISPARILTSVVLLLIAAVLGCAFSLRRVLRVDPASALGSSQ
jgi:putative ABC transport system permease protein